MLTQCPSCQTIFRVTSEILRIAHGQVRCGRCQTQFDALERLVEETEAEETRSGRFLRPSASTPTPSGQIEVEEPAAQEDITLEGRRIEITGTYRVPDASGHGEPQIREETVEEWVEIEDIDAQPVSGGIDVEENFEAGEEIEYDEPVDDEEAMVDAVDQAPTRHEEAIVAAVDGGKLLAPPHSPVTSHQSLPYPPPARHETPAYEAAALANPPATADGADFDLLPQRSPRTATARIWKILAAPLALLLLVQWVHNDRFTLARHPQLGPPLMQAYGALGLTLRPEWNLHAYEILQWHVGSDPAAPGTLTVRASIQNIARFAQPYPLLKLVLEDRWGEQVRSREFEPAEYLDSTTLPERLLAPAQRVNATIEIVDPGPDAEGFRFDVCLRGARGPVCAADVPEGS